MTRTASFIASFIVAAFALTCALACTRDAARHVEAKTAWDPSAGLPAGYRDWKLISVAREEGDIDDVRAILGNDAAIEAYRTGTLPFPDGAIIARISWSYDASQENNKTFGQDQSFVAGAPKNGVQFMFKDSKKFAATGGFGYAQFNAGQRVPDSALASCFPCHEAVAARDFVFTRYAP